MNNKNLIVVMTETDKGKEIALIAEDNKPVTPDREVVVNQNFTKLSDIDEVALRALL